MFDRQLTSLLLLAAAAFVAFMLLRRAGRRLDSTTDASRSAMPVRRALDTPDQPVEAPVELLRWQVEMHETARELKGQLDSKLAALQALVIAARREAERLEAAIAIAQSTSGPTKDAS